MIEFLDIATTYLNNVVTIYENGKKHITHHTKVSTKKNVMNLVINNNLEFKDHIGVSVTTKKTNNAKTKTVWIDTDNIKEMSRTYGVLQQLNITVETEFGNKYFSVTNKYSDIVNAYAAAS